MNVEALFFIPFLTWYCACGHNGWSFFAFALHAPSSHESVTSTHIVCRVTQTVLVVLEQQIQRSLFGLRSRVLCASFLRR